MPCYDESEVLPEFYRRAGRHFLSFLRQHYFTG